MPLLPNGSLPLVLNRNHFRSLSLRHITGRSRAESRMAAGVSMQSLSTRACPSTIGFPHMDLGQDRSLPGISAIEVVGVDLKLRPALRRDKTSCGETQSDHPSPHHTKGPHSGPLHPDVSLD